MACKRMIYREKRRVQAYQQNQEKRDVLLGVLKNKGGQHDLDEINLARVQFQKIKRDASRTRQRKRCAMCGRPRAVIGKFQLCRIHFREQGMCGFVAGLKKSSW